MNNDQKRYAAVVWTKIITEFSSRSLTFQDDKLPAVSALAQEVQKKSGWTYKSGLWLEDIHQGLLWEASGGGGRNAMYQAPSWSWASQDSPVSQGTGLFNETLGRIAEIIECSVVPRDDDPFGCITSGFLRIHGPWKMVRDWTGFTPYVRRQSGLYKTHLYSFASWTELSRDSRPHHPTQLICNLDGDNPGPPEGTAESISLIQISKTAPEKKKEGIFPALILQAVHGTESTFHRCGIAQAPVAGGHAEKG
jgi:hypothetical protein